MVPTVHWSWIIGILLLQSALPLPEARNWCDERDASGKLHDCSTVANVYYLEQTCYRPYPGVSKCSCAYGYFWVSKFGQCAPIPKGAAYKSWHQWFLDPDGVPSAWLLSVAESTALVAKGVCHNLGARLMVPTTQREHTELVQWLVGEAKYTKPVYFALIAPYTPLSDPSNWVWIHDHSKPSFSAWAAGYPKDNGGWCALLDPLTATWTNVNCKDEHRYICELID